GPVALRLDSYGSPRSGQSPQRRAGSAGGLPHPRRRVLAPRRRRARPLLPLADLLVELARFVERLAPLLAVDVQGGVERAGGEREARLVETSWRRHVSDRRLDRLPAALDPLDDPLENAHVLAVARPQEPAVAVAPEPVHP